jgi:hypothetical protein
MCIRVQIEMRIVPNIIPVTIFGRENQSMRLFLEFYIVEEKIKRLKESIWGNGFPPTGKPEY